MSDKERQRRALREAAEARVRPPFPRRHRLVPVLGLLVVALTAAGCADAPGLAPTEQIYFAFGTVTDEDGAGVEAVELQIRNQGNVQVAKTDEHGRWSGPGLRGSAVVIPAKENWYFSPAEKTVTFDNREVHFRAYRAGSTVVVHALLAGPEGVYPLQDATVWVNGRSARTDSSGRAFVHHLDLEEDLEWTLETDFGTFHGFETAAENIVVEAYLPLEITETHFRDGVFYYGNGNYRWEPETTFTVYFDYDERGGAALTESEKRRFEQDVLREFQSWFEDGERLGSFLRWGGQVDHELDANLIIRLVSDETFFARFTHYEDPETAPSHSPFFRFHNDYIVIAELWVRIDKLESRPSLYAQWFGRLAYLGRLSGRDVQRHESVMNWSDHAEQPTDLDRLMVKIKMHLPPLIPYNGAE